MKGVKKEALKEVVNWSFLDSQLLRDAVGCRYSFSSYGREKIVNCVKKSDVYSGEGKLILVANDLSIEFEELGDSRIVSSRHDGLQNVSTNYSCVGFFNGEHTKGLESLNTTERPHRLYFDSSAHSIRPLPTKKDI